jgi:hypothetical protein
MDGLAASNSLAPRDSNVHRRPAHLGGFVQLGLGLLPIAPILLLPFIIVFFVVVFPIWGVTLAILGILLLLVRGIDWLARAAGVTVFAGASRGLSRALRWVLTFGGFTERYKRNQV